MDSPSFWIKGEIGKLKAQIADLGYDAHLKGDQVKDPGAILHRGGKVTHTGYIVTAPHAFKIDGTAAERLTRKGGQNLIKGGTGDQLQVVGIVAGNIEVDRILAEKLPAEVTRQLEVDVVAAAEHNLHRARSAIAKVGELAVAGTEDGLLGCHIVENDAVVHGTKAGDGAAAAVNDDNLTAGGRLFMKRFETCLEGRKPGSIHHILVVALEELAIEKDGILDTVRGEVFQKKLVKLGRALQKFGDVKGGHPDRFHAQVLGDEVDGLFKLCAAIAVKGDEHILFRVTGMLADQQVTQVAGRFFGA